MDHFDARVGEQLYYPCSMAGSADHVAGSALVILPARPESPSMLMASSELSAVAPLISVAFVAPDEVDLSVLSGDQPVCALQRFPLPQFGTAVVWACQARGPADHWELAATKDLRTLAAPTFATSPDPTVSVP